MQINISNRCKDRRRRKKKNDLKNRGNFWLSYNKTSFDKLLWYFQPIFRLARAKRERDEMIEAKKREMSQQLAELEDGSDGPDEFEGNIVCNGLIDLVYC